MVCLLEPLAYRAMRFVLHIFSVFSYLKNLNLPFDLATEDMRDPDTECSGDELEGVVAKLANLDEKEVEVEAEEVEVEATELW